MRYLLVGAFLAGLSFPALAQETIDAANWTEAIGKLKCENVAKKPDGNWSVKPVVVLQGSRHENVVISDDAGKQQLQSRCGCPRTLSTLGVGC